MKGSKGKGILCRKRYVSINSKRQMGGTAFRVDIMKYTFRNLDDLMWSAVNLDLDLDDEIDSEDLGSTISCVSLNILDCIWDVFVLHVSGRDIGRTIESFIARSPNIEQLVISEFIHNFCTQCLFHLCPSFNSRSSSRSDFTCAEMAKSTSWNSFSSTLELGWIGLSWTLRMMNWTWSVLRQSQIWFSPSAASHFFMFNVMAQLLPVFTSKQLPVTEIYIILNWIQAIQDDDQLFRILENFLKSVSGTLLNLKLAGSFKRQGSTTAPIKFPLFPVLKEFEVCGHNPMRVIPTRASRCLNSPIVPTNPFPALEKLKLWKFKKPTTCSAQ